MFNLYLFGAPQVEHKGKAIDFDTRKAMALLAYLAVTQQTHSRDALATVLYPDADQARARASLRRTLSTLHSALGDQILDIERETIGLNPHAKLTVDVIDFQRAIAQTKKHRHTHLCANCLTALTRAAELYRDDFLAGFTLRDSSNFDDWQFFTAENLRREFASVLEKLVCYHSEQKAYASAIDYARRWLALDPLHEPAHRQLMLLYAWSNQRAAALRQYQECARRLEQELGVAPLAETTRLYQDIKQQGALGTVPQRSKSNTLSLPFSTPASQPLPFVGRAIELQTILQTYGDIRNDGQLIIIEGEAGIGKTHLAEEFLNHVSLQGATILAGRAYEGEANLAYGIFVEALRTLIDRQPEREKIPAAWRGEVARLVPELGNGNEMPPLDHANARARFFEGIRQTIFGITRGDTPGVLFFDDLQWADTASIDLLAYLIQRLHGQTVCIVATWRTDSLASIERLNQITASAHRAGGVTIVPLARLNQLAVTQMVGAIVGEAATLTQKIGARLYQETEGLPFFVVEYLHALDRGVGEIKDWSLPSGARNLLHARLATASEMGKQLLSTAAVIGRSFDFDTLREASGRTEEETIKTVEELAAQGLIKEIAAEAPQYDFAHAQLRELAYAETSAARRRLLHRRTADALANRGRARHELDVLASQIAWHYQLAGDEALAADYFKLAGDRARSLYANTDALAYYQNALALQHPRLAELHEAIGDLQTLLGDYASALNHYASAQHAGTSAMQATLAHKRGNVHHRRGEYALAEQHYQSALAALADEDASARAQLLVDWSLTAHDQGLDERAQDLASQALTLAETARDLRALARVRNMLGILARSRGDIAHARYQLEHSCAIAEALHDPGVRIAALNNLALVCRDNHEIERAIQLSETALTLCAALGDRHREAALHNNLADLFHALAQSEPAMAHLKQAVAIFAEIGEVSGMQPEIWKLVEW